MKSTTKVTVREVSPGTYRVAAVNGRNAVTGRFVRESDRSSLTASANHKSGTNNSPRNGKR